MIYILKIFTFPVTGLCLNCLMYSRRASYSKILPSWSQYGVLNAMSDTQQWSNGKRANFGFSIPGLLPPYNVDHSVYVRYLKYISIYYSNIPTYIFMVDK